MTLRSRPASTHASNLNVHTHLCSTPIYRTNLGSFYLCHLNQATSRCPTPIDPRVANPLRFYGARLHPSSPCRGSRKCTWLPNVSYAFSSPSARCALNVRMMLNRLKPMYNSDLWQPGRKQDRASPRRRMRTASGRAASVGRRGSSRTGCVWRNGERGLKGTWRLAAGVVSGISVWRRSRRRAR